MQARIMRQLSQYVSNDEAESNHQISYVQDPESQKRAAAANERKLLLRKAEAEEQLQVDSLM